MPPRSPRTSPRKAKVSRAKATDAAAAAAAAAFVFEHGTITEAMRSRGETTPQFEYKGILGGYRLHDHNIGQALRTLFHWHNETINVWVHVVGFIVCAVLLVHAGSFVVGAPLPLGPFGAAARACSQADEPIHCIRDLVLRSLPHEHVDELLAGLAAESHVIASSVSARAAAAAHALAARGAAHGPARAAAPPSGPLRPLARVREWLAKGRAAPFAALRAAREAAGPRHARADVAASGKPAAAEGGARAAALRRLHAAALLDALPPSAAAESSRAAARARLGQLAAALDGSGGGDGDGGARPPLERWPLRLFLASAMFCLAGSAIYHLFGTANARWTARLVTADYAGVSALIVGSLLPLVTYGYDAPEHRALGARYSLLLGTLGALVLALSGTALFHDEQLRVLRVGLFIALGFSGALPIGHALWSRGFEPVTKLMAGAAATTGSIYLLGCVFYISRFPEAYLPGRFDRLGSSHNIWHALIVVASIAHYFMLIELGHAAHAQRDLVQCEAHDESASLLVGHAPPGEHRWDACDIAIFAD